MRYVLLHRPASSFAGAYDIVGPFDTYEDAVEHILAKRLHGEIHIRMMLNPVAHI